MKRVITYGSFDLFHYGHLRLLQRARELGDYLIVAVSSDEFNLRKNKQTVINYQERSEIVKAIRYVDEVIPETCWEQKVDDIISKKIDIFVMGKDWEGKFDHLRQYCQVVYLERTPGICTTQIKKIIL